MTALEALRLIYTQANCRYEVEAQLGEEVWEPLGGCNETDARRNDEVETLPVLPKQTQQEQRQGTEQR